MYSGMLLIFLPLIIGYLIVLKNTSLIHRINAALGKLVFIILALMGMSLAGLDNLGENLSQIMLYTLTFFGCITLLNLATVPILDKLMPITTHTDHKKIPVFEMMLESLKLVGAVVAGFILGYLLGTPAKLVDKISEFMLLVLLLLIGIQLRNSGMQLKQILLNKQGMCIAGLIVISSLPGGMIAAWILDLPINQGLAMASGFGWYSLAGILMGDALGPVFGGTAFLNDMLRELAAVILIPLIIRRYPCTAVGYGGATALDFTLPVIQNSGGIHCVPLAIVSGFILSFLVPVLMLFFLSL
ncbi:lysine exporter LysO family protein [Endozoicomonadaceae bacterium StTr2]